MTKKELTINVSIGHLVAPKPTALITCVDADGRANIIAIAAVTVVSHRPPIFMIAVRDDRYSHDLIARSGEYVINMPSADMVEAAHRCGRTTGRNVNKFQESQFTPVPAKKVKAPIIAECPINIECKVVGSAKPGTHTLFFGEAVAAQAEEEVFDGTTLDLNLFHTLLYNYTEYRSPGKLIKQIP